MMNWEALLDMLSNFGNAILLFVIISFILFAIEAIIRRMKR